MLPILSPRLFAIALRSSALCLAALAGASPASAQDSQNISISASVVKPLTLTWVRNLDLGAIVLGPGSWSGAVVGISRAGTLACANTNVTCSGATATAQYKVTGTNRQVVRISAPNVTMVNQSDPAQTLLLTLDSPASVTMPNSGNQGVTFAIGGSIALSSTTAGGLYSGTFNVTVDY